MRLQSVLTSVALPLSRRPKAGGLAAVRFSCQTC